MKTFGWQGVEFETPEDWELTVDEGVFEKGYMRVYDSVSARMALKWETIKGEKVKPPRDTLKELKEQMKKKDKNVTFLREKGIRICGHPARCLHWRSTGEGYDAFWYCPKTGRAFIAELYFAGDEYLKVKPVVDKVFESLECHRKRNVQRWTVFGLNLHVPSEFKLVERSFYTARLHLVFQSKQSLFIMDRASFAQTLIGERYKDLRDWFEKDYRRGLKKRYHRLRYGRTRRDETLGHRGLILSGYYREGILTRRRYRVETRVWMCDVENSIFAVTTIRREGVNGKVTRALSTIMASIHCHGQPSEELETLVEHEQPVETSERPTPRDA